MTSSESSKTAVAKPAQQWVKPVCAVGGVVTVCGFGAYFLKRPGGTDMVKALMPAIVAIATIAE